MTAPTMPDASGAALFDVCERTTKGGRHLIYRLSVLQQPERARACGSGSKSQSDRRPVDPPPVIELRIYEGLNEGGGDPKDCKSCKDITFTYSANFFLFATLKQARVMAHGRVQNPAVNTPPVLTGMPVSGMAYLDRPHEAGYFLFPDLSIRHEGRYRLSFNLYEQTKNEADMDIPDDSDSDVKVSPMLSPEGSFDFRMEIHSAAFNVFSAKKFPGLKESTELSRAVAEQGCRVRIRREVRMRKRDGKHGDDNDDFSRRSRASQTPEPHRARSLSNSSDHLGPYIDGQRRPSGQDYPMPPGYPPAHSSNHLQFGPIAKAATPSFAQPAYPPPHHTHTAQPSPISPTSPLPRISQSSPVPYQGPHAQPSPYPPPPAQPAPYCNYSSRPGSQSYHVPPPPPAPITPSQDVYERRLSATTYPVAPPLVYSAVSEPDKASMHRPSVSYPMAPATPVDTFNSYSKPSLPSIAALTSSLPAATTTYRWPAMNTVNTMNTMQIQSPSAPIIEASSEGPIIPKEEPQKAGSKRRIESTFELDDGRLSNGRRPQDHHHIKRERGNWLNIVNSPTSPLSAIAVPRVARALTSERPPDRDRFTQRAIEHVGNEDGMWYKRANGRIDRQDTPHYYLD